MLKPNPGQPPEAFTDRSEPAPCLGFVTLDEVPVPRAVGERRHLHISLAWRLMDEERMLTRELPGYADDQQRVNYRLVPFIW